MTFGSKLQSLREEQSISQKELAGLVGVSTGIIAEWEADEAMPGLAELSRLSKALGVSSDVLLDATAETTVTPSVQPTQEMPAVVVPVKKRKKTGFVIGAIALCAALLVAGVVLWSQGVFTPEPLLFAEDTARIEAADASVVTIFCYDYDGELAATGSGFVAFDGKTIITNYHVMTSAYTCKISTNQDISYEVSKILCYSKDQDIAILQLAKETGLQPMTLGDSNIIKKGETVVAIGSPLGIKNTVSTGVLSGRLMEDNMDVLQFTAPISSGSSGGALFDNNGNVIGITFASYVDGQNLNLAIPIELAVKLYDNKGAAKSVSAIHIEEFPYVDFLENNKDIPEVTLSDLKANPKKYDGKVVKITAYVSSFYPDSDGEWKYCNLYISEKEDIGYNNDYKREIDFLQVEFQLHPSVHCSLTNCAIPNETIEVGDKVVAICEFEYYAKGEERHIGEDKYSWQEGNYEVNTAYFWAKYIYVD